MDVLDLGPGEILAPSRALGPSDPFDLMPEPEEGLDALREEIEQLLGSIHNDELRAATGYVRLAIKLLRVRDNQKWRDWGYRSWGAYIQYIGECIAKARSQIYAYIGVTETLVPILDALLLEDIGISKAGELKRYVKGSLGSTIPQKLLDVAVDPKKGIDELRAGVFEALHQKPDPKGRYWDLGGFFVSPDEKLELDAAFEMAGCVDPVIPKETPAPQAMKEKLLRMAREFVGTYSPTFEEQ